MNLKDQVTGSGADATPRVINLRPKFWRPSPVCPLSGYVLVPAVNH